VTKDQVDIWELSLSSIVDEYVATIEACKPLTSRWPRSSTDRAVLLELKARRLLPGTRLKAGGAGAGRNGPAPGRLLDANVKDASLALSRLMDSADLSVPRRAGLEERFLAWRRTCSKG